MRFWNRNTEKEEKFVAVIMCILCFMLVVLGLVVSFSFTTIIDSNNKDKSLIENTCLDKYNIDLVDSNYSFISKDFSGPYYAKNNTTNEIQEVYILFKDGNVSLYKKQTDSYIELVH